MSRIEYMNKPQIRVFLLSDIGSRFLQLDLHVFSCTGMKLITGIQYDKLECQRLFYQYLASMFYILLP